MADTWTQRIQAISNGGSGVCMNNNISNGPQWMKSYFVAIETGASVNIWDIKVIWSNFTFQQSKSYSN